MDEVEHVAADEGLDVEAEDALGHRAGVDEPTVAVDDGHDVVGVAHHRPEPGLVAFEERGHLVDGAGRPAPDHARRDDRQYGDGQEQDGRETLGAHALSVGIWWPAP